MCTIDETASTELILKWNPIVAQSEYKTIQWIKKNKNGNRSDKQNGRKSMLISLQSEFHMPVSQ